eukprot:CAMPEP_0113707610 /NCGR_PEP_ID=MMETSP0038_2-20120614/28496_1 /TAXON_ID=2898 /ORGANISM="Cryptomonas paramecium" /LENGTH=107 /DNA_ID=CAMNT_0000633173 /DNA_START=107 /DNA_END=430 /DNA_ORIENTATION=- /assembly_acc=CAM_ASM_000170
MDTTEPKYHDEKHRIRSGRDVVACKDTQIAPRRSYSFGAENYEPERLVAAFRVVSSPDVLPPPKKFVRRQRNIVQAPISASLNLGSPDIDEMLIFSLLDLSSTLNCE